MRWWGRLIQMREYDTAERVERFMDAARELDKHTFMHCIVNMVSDRKDMTHDDKYLLCLRIGVRMSETPRPERK